MISARASPPFGLHAVGFALCISDSLDLKTTLAWYTINNNLVILRKHQQDAVEVTDTAGSML